MPDGMRQVPRRPLNLRHRRPFRPVPRLKDSERVPLHPVHQLRAKLGPVKDKVVQQVQVVVKRKPPQKKDAHKPTPLPSLPHQRQTRRPKDFLPKEPKTKPQAQKEWRQHKPLLNEVMLLPKKCAPKKKDKRLKPFAVAKPTKQNATEPDQPKPLLQPATPNAPEEKPATPRRQRPKVNAKPSSESAP